MDLARPRYRIGYSHLVYRFDPAKAHTVPGSVALRDEAFAPQGVAGESTCTVGG